MYNRSNLTAVWIHTRPWPCAIVGLGTKPASPDPVGMPFYKWVRQPASGTVSGEGNSHYLIGYQTRSVKPFGGGGETREPRLWEGRVVWD